MDKIEVTKKVISFAVGMGTGKIVNDIIKSNVTADKVIDQVTVVSAGVVIGSMAKDATKSYTDAKIDEIVAKWREFKTKQNQTENV